MSKRASMIKEILGEGGRLQKILEDFEFRPSQQEMALLVEAALRDKVPCAVEAGTGTGKTFGYLVPIILSGKKAVISTGTKNLQEQIFLKDIPLLERAMDVRIDAVLMKGRRNYLCLYKFDRYSRQIGFFDKDAESVARRMEGWLRRTVFADRSELEWLGDEDPLWEQISSSSEQCLGPNCPFSDSCYQKRLNAAAARASLLIVNHHLFFADLKVRAAGYGEVIPRCEVAVFDEAHEVEDTATEYFGSSISTARLTELADDIEREVKGFKDEQDHGLISRSRGIKEAAQGLVQYFQGLDEKGPLEERMLLSLAKGPVEDICTELEELADDPGVKRSERPGLQALGARAKELSSALKDILVMRDRDWVHWYEKRKRSVSLNCSPLDISGQMSDTLYRMFSSVVFTSATLTAGGSFSFIASRLGLPEGCITESFPSHFDFSNQTILYLPKDLPAPDEAGFAKAAAGRIEEIIAASEGRALVLFTSYQNLNLAWDRLEGRIPYTLLKQGTAPRSALLDRFKRDVHSVLLATSSFWQGVDVPGEALSCLVIDKLPFESPSEPLVAARISSMTQRGQSPFMEYQLPVAVLALKQGVGRLIRKQNDRGVVAILDKRIMTRRYGEIFLKSLPPMPVVHELEGIRDFFSKGEKTKGGTKTVESAEEQQG
jgi:ATP-dependent DNA helicase DinG